GCPKLSFGVVDVRDVADLHLRAMSDPAAKGERFLAVAGDFMSIRGIALVLKHRLGTAARRVPTLQLPNWLVRLAALRDPAVKQILPDPGRTKTATGVKGRRWPGGHRARTRMPWSPPPRAWCSWACSRHERGPATHCLRARAAGTPHADLDRPAARGECRRHRQAADGRVAFDVRTRGLR